MAFTVMNNPSAVMSLGELNKNINNQSKSQKKLATGMKINGAGDDASAYTISERMRSHLRALNQDIDNVKNGRAMLSVAAGGIDNIVQELRNLKELAIKSANDSNTDKDRETIQKEFEQKMANIDDIATETNYNGKLLLDGRYGSKFHRVAVSNGNVGGVGNVPVIGQNEPTGTPIVINAGNYTISSDGVYELANGYTGDINIASGVKNVKIQQQNPANQLNEVHIAGPSTGNANLWIEGLNILNNSLGNIIQFKGSDNFLSVKGNNVLTKEGVDGSIVNSPGSLWLGFATIHVGDGLTVEGTGQLNINMKNDMSRVIAEAVSEGKDYSFIAANVISRFVSSGAGIGTNSWEDSTADIKINSGNINIQMKNEAGQLWSYNDPLYGQLTAIYGGLVGAGIGAGGSGTIGNIEINGGNINVETFAGAGIGSGLGYYDGYTKKLSTAGDITIDNANVTVSSMGGAGIGSGEEGIAGDIIIGNNAVIAATGEYGAGIGSGCKPIAYGRTSLDTYAGDITISRQASITANSTNGEAIGKGWNASIGTITYVDDLNLWGKKEGDVIYDWQAEGNPLIIHHGPKANQAIHCYINDMHTDAMGLSGTKVVTREDAQWALSDDSTDPPRIGAIDQAINYALNEATTVGAYISRLETTEDNLVISSENAQSSESTIRDADMAKEMAEFTKNNVLAQASQSMLAQANQNSSSVLSLLQ